MTVLPASAKALAASAAVAAGLLIAPPAYADDFNGFSGCESVPIFGIDPYIRKICDDPLEADGSWVRYRQRVDTGGWRLSCNSGLAYISLSDCPLTMQQRTWYPTVFSDVDVYALTADIVPPGEPGHLDNPIRCRASDLRCDPM